MNLKIFSPEHYFLPAKPIYRNAALIGHDSPLIIKQTTSLDVSGLFHIPSRHLKDLHSPEKQTSKGGHGESNN